MTSNVYKEVTLTEILEARERRAERQRELISGGSSVISFTMNIAGPRKVSPLIRRAFFEGVRALDEALSPLPVLSREVLEESTGFEAFYAVRHYPEELKKICVDIETGTPVGRLFDMDVINDKGEKLSRDGLRRCIICDAVGLACARSRAHSVKELWERTEEIITDGLLMKDKKTVGEIAEGALLSEVYTTPKPGLVDLNNSGSHTDMDVGTFELSAKALRPYLEECFEIGVRTKGDTPNGAFLALRKAGIEAEKAMYSATDGVNTHKGAIYSFGIICGSLGRLWEADAPFKSAHEILSTSASLVKESAIRDLKASDGSTAGTRLYIEKGIMGIRGEAKDGFPSVKDIALPRLCSLTEGGMSLTEAGAIALLHLILSVDDTSLYKRGGDSGIAYAKEYAKRLTAKERIPTIDELLEMDSEFTKRNLSPGGCADLLALSYFLYNIENNNKH